MSLADNYVLANQLDEKVVGKKIAQAVVNQNPHAFVWFAMKPEHAFQCHPEGYEDYLTGKTIEKSAVNLGRYGVYNFLYVGERALMFNIPTRYYAPDEKLPKRHQLLLLLDDHSAVAFTGSLGGPIFLFEVDASGLPINYQNSKSPSVLSDEFSLVYFMNLAKAAEPKLSAKAFLATKNRIPGLDNSILQEILWEAKVNPKSLIAALTDNDFIRIYEAIKSVFPAIIDSGGKDTDKDLFGKYGSYATKASRNTAGKPCTRCGEPIVKEAYLGGAVYYCPACQVIP